MSRPGKRVDVGDGAAAPSAPRAARRRRRRTPPATPTPDATARVGVGRGTGHRQLAGRRRPQRRRTTARSAPMAAETTDGCRPPPLALAATTAATSAYGIGDRQPRRSARCGGAVRPGAPARRTRPSASRRRRTGSTGRAGSARRCPPGRCSRPPLPSNQKAAPVRSTTVSGAAVRVSAIQEHQRDGLDEQQPGSRGGERRPDADQHPASGRRACGRGVGQAAAGSPALRGAGTPVRGAPLEPEVSTSDIARQACTPP